MTRPTFQTLPLDLTSPTPSARSRDDAGHGLTTPRAEPHLLYDGLKRLLDVTLSIALIVVTMPVMVVSSIAILLTTGQNPLLLQRRVGFHGKAFGMLKLRTMSASCVEEQVHPGEVFVAKSEDDLRVTRIGRLLRRSSIDELPQLFNVLAGRMSLVGPRPGLPVEAAHYPHSWQRRLDVKPGLTGLWQVSGRGNVPPWRRTAMDRRYIRCRSLSFDCLILLRTVAATFSMRGAW